MAARRAPFGGITRALLQTTAVIVALGTLVVPPVAILASGTASLDATWTALRIAAVEAFSVIFLNIVTGALRPFFNRVFKARTVQRAHVASGLAGFSLALAHGITALVYGITGYRTGAVFVGPAALGVLCVAIAAAFARRRLSSTWRWIHRLNHLAFAAVFIHGLVLGYDLANEMPLKVLFSAYVAVAASALAYRLFSLGRPLAAQRETEGNGAIPSARG